MLSVRGKWVAGVSAGGVENYATNPQYRCDNVQEEGLFVLLVSSF